MKQLTLFTFGYLSGRAERIITELIAVKTPIVDIRFNPDSKNWKWKQNVIAARNGILYSHIPDLGNELYKDALSGQFTEPHIKLHNIENGLALLDEILTQHGRAAIFCACGSKTKCHRIEVARLARERLGVRVIHL